MHIFSKLCSEDLDQKHNRAGSGNLFQLGKDPQDLKVDYYIGSSDSCQGDSGGPLFVYHGKRFFPASKLATISDH